MSSLGLEKLLQQRKELEARIQQAQARSKVQHRKDETRRKIIAGSYVLEKHEKENTMSYLMESLDQFLYRKVDRQLFGLPEREEEYTETATH